MNTTVIGPTTEHERIAAIDVLRGVALLGILLVNIRAFAMVSAVYFNPAAAGPIDEADRCVWWLGQLFVEQKFMAVFSMLFGAGVILMSRRRDAADLPAAGTHYRRMVGLLVIGLAHAYLIWYGDILVGYALCGMLIFPLRRWRAKWLIVAGLTALGIGTLLNLFVGLTIPYWPPESVQDLNEMIRPDGAAIEKETAVYQGSWWGQTAHRAPTSAMFQTFVFLMWGLWRIGGLMLLGMALLKLGVLSGQASKRAYTGLIFVAIVVGLPLILAHLWLYPADQRGTGEAFFIGALYNYWGSIPLAIGYIAIVMLICQVPLRSYLRPLAAVGRTALSNYLLQSILCTLLFYGHGFGLFGRMSWMDQMGIVLIIWLIQLGASALWMSRFRMGPVEVLWRWSTYGKLPAMRAGPTGSTPASEL